METKKISFQFFFLFFFILVVVIILCCTRPPSVFPVGFARTQKILADSGCLAGFLKVQLNI